MIKKVSKMFFMFFFRLSLRAKKNDRLGFYN